jgi:hypothetical protein
MKITICGSIKFADKLVGIYRELEELGHEPMMHEQMFGLADGTAEQLKDLKNGVEKSEIKKKYDYIKWWDNCIKSGDAILVCNFDKNGIKNYISGNVLMEIGFAHVNDKKVFLLNPIPEGVSYTDEIEAMTDVILNGDLNKIK